jgi:hydroxymethylbilane synthase
VSALRPIIVGSRGSALALRQTEEVVTRLRDLHPEREFVIQTIRTRGDTASEAPLARLGRGIFVKELENALLAGEIDLAVHSLKDLPTLQPRGLTLAAICQRQDPRDALVNRWGVGLMDLPPGARIGTSSPRRVAQLMALRPDIEVLPIRGNVDTRLRKAQGSDYDGAILAVAGLLRMGLDGHIAEYLDPRLFTPAPGQGALAVEAREDDAEALALAAPVEHLPTRLAATAERALLEALGGGCQVPVAAYGQTKGEELELVAMVSQPDGRRLLRTAVRGKASEPREVALEAYRNLLEMGAGEILKETVR